MLSIANDTVVIDKETHKLQGFRLEDTNRAPAVIVFVDEEKPELLPVRQGQAPPTRIKSANMEADIQVITMDEIHAFLKPA
jgi:hypothetical protein